MSIKIMSQVWDRSRHKGSNLLLLLAIADNANDDGIAWPGQEYLAQKIRMSKRTVQRLVGELEESGEMEVIHPGGSGPKDTTRYRIILPDKGDNLTTIDSQDKGDILSSKGDMGDQKGGHSCVTRTVIEPSLESSLTKEPTVDEMFATFWAAYPKPVKGRSMRQDSLTAFKVAIKKVDLQTLLDAIEWWKKTDKWRQSGGEYVDGAQKWLRKQMWVDAEEDAGGDISPSNIPEPQPSPDVDWNEPSPSLAWMLNPDAKKPWEDEEQ